MTKASNGVPAPIRRVFDDLEAALPGAWVKEFPATAGKLGLRTGASRVVFTYNSYKKGWLDTSARLGPKLRWFSFRPTHNKANQYWAVELEPERVEETYRSKREEIVADLSEIIRSG